MDAVLNQLQQTIISPYESDDFRTTSFDSLYKNWGKLGNQDERRQELLGVQKSNRNTSIDKCRGILELVQAVENAPLFDTPNTAYYKPSIYVAGFIKAPTYSKVLMMSEWMVEKPFDFDTNWLAMPSPKGTRVLVVACHGSTRLYTKHGHLLMQCRTRLPGGNPSDPKAKVHCCVLDGFYQKKGEVLHIMDILAWNSQPMTDGELEFRDYWLRSHVSELTGITKITKRNELIINILPKVSCEPDTLNQFMSKLHFEGDASLDGLLFFHKKAHYFSGDTPLVGWLYPYMVPEILGSHYTVNSEYMSMKPENYTNQADFIIEFNTKMEKKNTKALNRKHRTRSNNMDTMDVVQTETKVDKSTPKSRKPKTESMEAEAISNSTNQADLLVAAIETCANEVSKKTTMDEKTPAAMEAEVIEKNSETKV